VLVYWGYRGAGGPPGAGADPVIRAACAVELLHVCALVHDDLMDASDLRRGAPAVHVQFAGLHRGEGWRGDPDTFGAGAAILLGDLALTWADAALTWAGIPADRLGVTLEVFNALRREMMGGQYLDLVEGRRGGADLQAVRRVLTFKSAKYTVERPLHMGAALAGGHGSEVTRCYSAYGLPLGEAFQLRDDILGVFGEPARTGKPAGEDLREGKETWLVVRARERCGPAGRRLLDTSLGDPKLTEDTVGALRTVIVESGALEETEARIAELVEEALAGIDHPAVAPDAAGALRALAELITSRDH
jgi:geranylgeranyl diphosphate synthase type I